MDILEILGLSLFIGPVKELIDSMRRSKTLTIMVIVGLIFSVGFTFFLIKMASSQ